jgi:acyl dehydratase
LQGSASDELAIGSKFVSHRRTITEADVTLFTALTWITDPIFTDDVFASSTQFGRRVAPGPLLMAFALGLTEELVYGTTLAAMGINNALFRKPVAPGSTIYVETVIGGKRESASRPGTSIVQFKHEVFCHGSTDVVASFERNMLLGSRRFLDDLARERESVR